MVSVAVVLDTSVVLNLVAAGVGVAVLKALEVECFVCSAVADEAIYIRSDDPAQPREAVSIDPWRLVGALDVTSPKGSLDAPRLGRTDWQEHKNSTFNLQATSTIERRCRWRSAGREGTP